MDVFLKNRPRIIPRPPAGQPIQEEAIGLSLKSIHKEKAPGLSGWTRPLLDLATREKSVRLFLRLLADMIRQGTAPGSSLLCAARLIGLEKKDGGIRPIAIGDMIYRLAMKAILLSYYKPSMLLPNQLGVKSPGGVEPAIFLIEEAIQGPNRSKYRSLASLDLSNAFNSIERSSIATTVAKYAPSFYRAASWAYNSPSILVTTSGATLASAEGVRQGDPLGPLLFSLALRPTLEVLIRKLPTAAIVAYLDDIFILDRGSKSLEAAKEVFRDSPLILNPRKSKEYSLKDLRQEGLAVLGTFLGPLEARKSFLKEQIETLKGILLDLASLPKQYGLLLLRGSIHLLLRHLLRQLDPNGLARIWKTADEAIEGALRGLAARRLKDLPFSLNPDLIAIPARDGGLGIPIHMDIAREIYLAAQEASLAMIRKIVPSFRVRVRDRVRVNNPSLDPLAIPNPDLSAAPSPAPQAIPIA